MKWLKTTAGTLINTKYVGQLRIATVNTGKFYILAEFYYPNTADRENFYLGEFSTQKEALVHMDMLLEKLNNDKETAN